MGRRFAAAWWAALCAVLVCLCATAPPVRQAEYPPWDGAPYFDAGPDRVDVNTAPAAELETLPGIGEKKALAIVEYREANGPFRAVEELERVSLAVPQVTYLMKDLKKAGLDVNTSVTTIEEAKKEIMKLC